MGLEHLEGGDLRNDKDHARVAGVRAVLGQGLNVKEKVWFRWQENSCLVAIPIGSTYPL